MASPEGFSLFPKLPAELRIMIWEMSILEHNRDRLVPVQVVTQRVVCTYNLACSPHFSATWESRKVATDLYPIRLPRIIRSNAVNTSLDSDLNKYPSKGAIYISTEHDIFVLSIEILTEGMRPPSVDETEFKLYQYGFHYGWSTPSLTTPQCQRVKRIMMPNRFEPYRLRAGCHRDLQCVIRCHAMFYWDTWYDGTLFSGVQKCLFAVVDEKVVESSGMYLNVHLMSGPSVLATLKQANMLAFFDRKDVDKYREEGEPPHCVCAPRRGEGQDGRDSG
ncbi:hypothetical protein F4680DRAFT_467254 [Xylaria scruposa]|nr:hypothetical protein F4680DRAFT_467254 [Xylaria scruposa]